MHYNLPGHAPRPPTSFVPPLLPVVLALGLLGAAWWAYEQSKVVRATDSFAYNGLSAIAVIAGVLWLPFALTSLGIVIRNRRHRRKVMVGASQPLR